MGKKSPCLSCKNKNVYDPLTKCFVCNFSGIECKNFEMYKPNSQTNASKIRSMTDEELAEWLERIRLCCSTDLCGKICPFSEVCYSSAEAPKETLDWLKQEVNK